jgi:hypothetical protein
MAEAGFLQLPIGEETAEVRFLQMTVFPLIAENQFLHVFVKRQTD